jgi:hypothetical protein
LKIIIFCNNKIIFKLKIIFSFPIILIITITIFLYYSTLVQLKKDAIAKKPNALKNIVNVSIPKLPAHKPVIAKGVKMDFMDHLVK